MTSYSYVIYERDVADGIVNIDCVVDEMWFKRYRQNKMKKLSKKFDDDFQTRTNIIEVIQEKHEFCTPDQFGYRAKIKYKYGSPGNERTSEDWIFEYVEYKRVLLYDPIEVIE